MHHKKYVFVAMVFWVTACGNFTANGAKEVTTRIAATHHAGDTRQPAQRTVNLTGKQQYATHTSKLAPKPTKATPVSAQPDDYRAINKNVDAFFGTFINAKTPGGVVIVLKDGQIIHQAAYGLANLKTKTPLTVDHIFHLASMGKPMTALCIMRLAEQGKLSYDDPISKYIPEISQFGDTFTIRQVLHHTSGLPDYGDGITDALLARSANPTNVDMIAVLHKKRKLLSAPGDAFYYSNAGYDMLAVLIERVSGELFPDFVQKHIFDPLHMKNTFSLPDKKRRSNAMVTMSYTGSRKKPEAYPIDPLDNIYGSGSVYATIGDMALYDEALYGNTLVSQKTFQEALNPATLNDGSVEQYGFGLEFEKWQKETFVAHSGAWLGFNNDYVRFPQRHFSVIVLLNRDYEYPDNPRIALKVAEFYLK
ncbi:MAG: serine hydrolase [Chloroflexales bacterium]|nr:serine hydrolase [Chloroflexales bacterium]